MTYQHYIEFGGMVHALDGSEELGWGLPACEKWPPDEERPFSMTLRETGERTYPPYGVTCRDCLTALRAHVAFESTGDPEKDAEEHRRIMLSMGRERQGLCPNGCAPVIWDDEQTRRCPSCGFVGMHSTLGVQRLRGGTGDAPDPD